MIFASCRPDLAEPARVALTRYAASGLSTAEIAAAFLVPDRRLWDRAAIGRAAVRLRSSPQISIAYSIVAPRGGGDTSSG